MTAAFDYEFVEKGGGDTMQFVNPAEKGASILHAAAQGGNADIVKLVSVYIDVNQADNNVSTCT